MTDPEYIDLVLTTLFRNLDRNGLCLRRDILKPNNCDNDQNEILRIGRIVEATGLAITDDTICFGVDIGLVIQDEGVKVLSEHGSYLKYLEFIKKTDKKENQKSRRDAIVKISSLAIGAIGLFWGIYKDNQSDKKDNQIEILEKQIKEHYKTMDSLQRSVPTNDTSIYKFKN